MHVTLRQIAAAVVAIGLATAGSAAVDSGSDSHKLVGTVLMMTPSAIKVGTDSGDIESLKITDSSELGRHIYEGDRAEIWYRVTADQSKVVVRTATSGTATSEATVSHQTRVAAASPDAEPGRTSSAEAAQASTGGGHEAPAYDEVVGNPEEVMITDPDRPVLPQTASNLPALGLTGVIALLVAGALSVLAVLSTRRSGS
jgi:hypothetical protein